MAKKSFSVGILDKAGRMVKSESGWLPIKGNEALVDWTLEENARHKDVGGVADSEVSDTLPPKTVKEKAPPKEKTAKPEKVKKETTNKPIVIAWQKEQYDWGKLLAVKENDTCVLSLTEDNVKAVVLVITSVKDDELKGVVEFKDKEGVEGIIMNWHGDSENPVTKTVKVMTKGTKKADYYLPYEAFNFKTNVHDFSTPKEETKEEKKVKKETIVKNNKENAKNYKVPKHAK